MHLPSVIHRRHFQQDITVHEIKRRARLSRNTPPQTSARGRRGAGAHGSSPTEQAGPVHLIPYGIEPIGLARDWCAGPRRGDRGCKA